MLLVLSLMLVGQEFGYHPANQKPFDAEKREVEDLWVLDFEFRQPRFVPTIIPGEGRKMAWYMVYKVVNRTGEPRTLIPRFELITNPGSPKAGAVVGDAKNPKELWSRSFTDVLIPNAEKMVRAREGQETNFFNSVSIQSQPIPPTPKEGAPIERYGVVFWKDVPMGETKKFNIYVTGLSNGYRRIQDPMDKKKETILRKTLELRFSKPGDDFNTTYKEIRLDGFDWTYRPASP